MCGPFRPARVGGRSGADATKKGLREVAIGRNSGTFVVVDRFNGRQTIIAEVDYAASSGTSYEGPIQMIQSVPYQVEWLDS